MKTIGNIIWFLLIGIGSALGWWLMGLILCITIIGIPFGTQCFKRSEEHTSELQSRGHLVCRLLLEKKKH